MVCAGRPQVLLVTHPVGELYSMALVLQSQRYGVALLRLKNVAGSGAAVAECATFRTPAKVSEMLGPWDGRGAPLRRRARISIEATPMSIKNPARDLMISPNA
jgi:hypothetical protein